MDLFLRLGAYGLSLDLLADRPHGIDLGPLTPARAERVRHRGALAELAPEPLARDLPRLEGWLDAPRELVLIGRRSLRSNNSWMNGLPSLAKGADRSRLLIHPEDAVRLEVADGAEVELRSAGGAAIARARVSDEVSVGVVSLPHGFEAPNVNALTDAERVEPILGVSILNGVPVSVTPTSAQGAATTSARTAPSRP